jgi:hypothetical protein
MDHHAVVARTGQLGIGGFLASAQVAAVKSAS